MRKVLFLICALGIPYGAWAQTSQSSWANLSALRAGQKIQVVEMNSKKHSGSFVSVSDTAITFQEPAGERTIPHQNVRNIKLMKSNHRLRNTLVGAGVGGGVGAGIGALNRNDRSSRHRLETTNVLSRPTGRSRARHPRSHERRSRRSAFHGTNVPRSAQILAR
jgi:hypothetical protein